MITAALIGAGNRGMQAYGSYALKYPHEVKFVAIAEPNGEKRNKFSALHQIESSMAFESWEELLEKDKFCDALLICSPDRFHYTQVMKAIKKGYNILLEKPMSPNPQETLEIAKEATDQNVLLSVCHVLRYAPFYQELKLLIDSKVIGDIMSIQWNENVGYYHQAHSFVRGNWRNTEESSPMLLQKCSHDLDMLQWLIGSSCQSVSSYGSLSYFKEENAPEGSTMRCLDGCKVEKECPYSAIKWYLHERDEWPANVVSVYPTIESRLKALQEGPYGRCVYRCDNDVVDHQTVNMLFENDVTVAFTMSAFTKDQCRTFKIMGTKGEIEGNDWKNELIVRSFSGKTEVITPESISGGHMGADTSIMSDFIARVERKEKESLTSALVSAHSHLIVFAAEESRLSGKTVDFQTYVKSLEKREEVPS
ncbi:Gfo/Idh/MocA family protein [Lederbergia citrea]|uniref:Gfo/Idh/MocA family oxidoreductase n=1 Tax=Lederbergia citrea TaxID=2833581 RepID=A0A942Z6H7_9BACI|nr:Gfo/Idh/MocA family oxidoreductase [Lederbergia citrea]MBS4179376.1 Gfo/Idh/MocA family oxidoreductase [Lederbergia citrea]MBS4206046.1 Gfo/Idh/MocA family oxidoreductase [Lederbergia citrea]MBS4224505.1 Gfo/Idh/MocA family oxidoreductase [Lederbergia citrea]